MRHFALWPLEFFVRGHSARASLSAPFPGFGAAVAEKRLIQAGNLGQPFGQFRLVLVIEQVGDVNQPARLALEHTLDGGMRVPERIDPEPAEEIETAFPFRVPQVDAPSPGKENPLAIVGGKQQRSCLGTHYGCEVHAPITSVPYSSLVK